MNIEEKKKAALSVAGRFTALSELGDPANWAMYLRRNPEPGSAEEIAQLAMRNVSFWREHGRDATNEEELLNDSATCDSHAKMQANMRMILALSAENVFSESGTNTTTPKPKTSSVSAATTASIKKSMAPAPEGTVSQLAEKYNKSKSEIRKLKREGRLAELTNA